jgi:hypothetical protein
LPVGSREYCQLLAKEARYAPEHHTA